MDNAAAPFTLMLILANVIAYLYTTNNRTAFHRGVMWPYEVHRRGEYYRFISSGFLHADLPHLFFNMFTLYFFGQNLEWAVSALDLGGETIFLLLYTGALIVSDMPTYFRERHNPSFRSLGASGAVSAVVFAVILFNPWGSIYLYGAIRLSAALYAVLFLAYCIYMGKKGQDNIHHEAHLWGAVFGLAFMLVVLALKRPELLQMLLEELKHPSLLGR